MTILIDPTTNTVYLSSKALVGLVRTCAEVLDVSEQDSATLTDQTKVLVIGGTSFDDPDVEITSLTISPEPMPGHHRRRASIHKLTETRYKCRPVLCLDGPIGFEAGLPHIFRSSLTEAMLAARQWVTDAPSLNEPPIRLNNTALYEDTTRITNCPEGTSAWAYSSAWAYWDYPEKAMRYFSHEPRYAGRTGDDTWICYFRDGNGGERLSSERQVTREEALSWVRSAPAR